MALVFGLLHSGDDQSAAGEAGSLGGGGGSNG